MSAPGLIGHADAEIGALAVRQLVPSHLSQRYLRIVGGRLGVGKFDGLVEAFRSIP